MARYEIPPLAVVLNSALALALGVGFIVSGVLWFFGLGADALVLGGAAGLLVGAGAVVILVLFVIAGLVAIGMSWGLWQLEEGAWRLDFFLALITIVVSILFFAVALFLLALFVLLLLYLTANEYGIRVGRHGRSLT